LEARIIPKRIEHRIEPSFNQDAGFLFLLRIFDALKYSSSTFSAARLEPIPNQGRNMEPFQQQLVVALEAGTANGGAFETVPAGKRAVIKHVSVYATGDGTEKADYFITSTSKTIRPFERFRSSPRVERLGSLEAIPAVRSPLQELSSAE
jgi:hypothetical protein